jgi:outer membrane murein-binding lipoprotein Lpp
MPRRVLTVAAAGGCALLIAGCTQTAKDSATDFQGAQREVAQVVEDLQQAASRRNAAEICTDLVTQAFAQRIAAAQRKRTCEDGLDPILDDVNATELTVEGVQVDGTSATANVLSEATGNADDRRDRFTLRRVGATWRLDSLG